MPDDVKEEIAEQEEVDDALKSFLEEDEEKPHPDDEIEDESDESDKEGDDKDDKDDDKASDDKDDKKDDKEDKKESDDKPEYSEALEKRLKQLDEKEDKPEEKEDPPPKDEKEDEKEPPKKEQEKDEKVEIDFNLSDDDFSKDLKAYRDDYPEDFNAITEIATTLVKKVVGQIKIPEVPNIDESKFVKPDTVESMASDLSDLLFWRDVRKKHPDAEVINDSKEFVDFLYKKGNESIRRLAQGLETVDDAVMVLDYYKANKAKKEVDKVDKDKKDKKAQHDNLHKGSMRNKTTPKKADTGVDKDDAKAAFEEDDDD